jgi:hypothetical protein
VLVTESRQTRLVFGLIPKKDRRLMMSTLLPNQSSRFGMTNDVTALMADHGNDVYDPAEETQAVVTYAILVAHDAS